jgi:hypothetical protein
VVVTRHGSIVSKFAKAEEKDAVLALKWTALEPSAELEVVFRMNKAKDWESFKEALTYFIHQHKILCLLVKMDQLLTGRTEKFQFLKKLMGYYLFLAGRMNMKGSVLFRGTNFQPLLIQRKDLLQQQIIK